MAKAAVPVAAHLLVLLQQLHWQQQEIVEVKGVVGSKCLAVTPVDIGGELARCPSAWPRAGRAANPDFWRC